MNCFKSRFSKISNYFLKIIWESWKSGTSIFNLGSVRLSGFGQNMVPQAEFDWTFYCDKYHERFRTPLIFTPEKRKVAEIITTHHLIEQCSSTLKIHYGRESVKRYLKIAGMKLSEKPTFALVIHIVVAWEAFFRLLRLLSRFPPILRPVTQK